jgi:hypothetical protein
MALMGRGYRPWNAGLDLDAEVKVYRRRRGGRMHIKDLADRAGVTVRAVRYYESRGLISPRRDRADVCPASLSAYRQRIADIDARIAELTALRGQLTDLLAQAESYRPGVTTP